MINVDAETGRALVSKQELRQFRKQLGLNRSSMAELLQTSIVTYTQWEARPTVRLWPVTAERIGRFHRLASRQLADLHAHGIRMENLMPFHHATTVLGVPQELLLRRYREGSFEAEDLGILGLWVHESDLERIRKIL